jgi:hypothetical protein
VGREKVKEEKQRSGADGGCKKVERGGGVKDESEVMCGAGDGAGAGGAQAIELRHLAL